MCSESVRQLKTKLTRCNDRPIHACGLGFTILRYTGTLGHLVVSRVVYYNISVLQSELGCQNAVEITTATTCSLSLARLPSPEMIVIVAPTFKTGTIFYAIFQTFTRRTNTKDFSVTFKSETTPLSYKATQSVRGLPLEKIGCFDFEPLW